jgi:glycosyltransferase involved in cell wall biosynthesis
MKVLHIHSGNLYGGVESFLLTLARSRHLAPSMAMSAALCFDDRIAAALRREGLPTSILGAVRLRRPDTVWRARQELAQLLASHHFDVAICHQAWPHAIFGSVVKAAGLPLVSWMHMASAGHWIDRLASRVEPDLIVCNSRFTASTLPATGVRVETVYCPVIPTSSAAATARTIVREQFQTADDAVVIVQVSRMEAWKGHQIHLQALGSLRAVPNWTCWFVGGAQNTREARYVESLEHEAARLGISNRVRFVGHRSDVPDVLAAADIFCQPNIAPEPFGLSFVEALGAGLPVVSSSIGGALEIVDSTCGILLPPGDLPVLATALLRLISDRETRKGLAHAGPYRARTLCDPHTQMTAIAAVLERARCDRPVAH